MPFELAKQLTTFLPWDSTYSARFLEHVTLAHELGRRQSAKRRSTYSSLTLQAQWRGLQALFAEKYSEAPSSGRTKEHYWILFHEATTLLSEVSPDTDPLIFAQVALLLSNVECVLDRADQALQHATLAKSLLEDKRPASDSESVAYTRLLIETRMHIATALHNLELEKEARLFSEQSIRVVNWEYALPRQEIANAQVGMSKMALLSLCETPHFTLKTALDLERDASKACEELARTDEQAADIHQFGVKRALGLAYLQHQNGRKAIRVLIPLVATYQHISGLGNVTQATFLRDLARSYYLLGEEAEWQYYVGQALSLMTAWGMDHQLRLLQRSFGADLPMTVE